MGDNDGDILSDEEYQRLQSEVQSGLSILAKHHEAVFNAAESRGEIYTLHYARYGMEETEVYLTLSEAVAAAEAGEDAGEMYARHIIGPGGARYSKYGAAD